MLKQYLLVFAFLSSSAGKSLHWDSGHKFCYDYAGAHGCINCDHIDSKAKCEHLENIIRPPVAPLAAPHQMPFMQNPVQGMPNPAYGMPNPAYGMSNPAYGMPNPAYGMSNPAYGMSNPEYGMSNPALPPMVVHNVPVNCPPLNCNPCNCSPPCFGHHTAATGEGPGGGPAISLVLAAVTFSLLGLLNVHGIVLPV
ncbi:hypothetical protein niasHT_002856 [Heterodera trifolii]|uniref:Uncharacterized protein n=1 Tax=Heterodera trifolii TaxID=157864 RepID=A0ABD2LQU7_9BILA